MKRSEKARNLELRLLKALRNDSSASISKIARKLRAPVTTVFEAEKKLRREGIIARHYSAIDFEMAGFPIRALLFIGVEKERLQDIADMLKADKNVNNLQLLEGNFLFADAVFARMGRFLRFSEKISGMKKTEFYAIEEAKTDAAAIFY